MLCESFVAFISISSVPLMQSLSTCVWHLPSASHATVAGPHDSAPAVPPTRRVTRVGVAALQRNRLGSGLEMYSSISYLAYQWKTI